jgi:hypothetical protein
MDAVYTLPKDHFSQITETLISNTDCATQRTYNDGSQIAEFMEKIYRIIDGKHDFEDSRSYLNATQCNNSILKEQLSGTATNGDVAGYKIIKYICTPGRLVECTPILGPTALTSGANTLHGFVDFETGLQKHPFVPGQYIKVEVKNGMAVYASYCVDRPFIGEYHIEESKSAGKSKSPTGTSNTPAATNLWKDELKQLIQDRQIYGKRAIYKIYFGSKDTFKDWLNSNDNGVIAPRINERIAKLEEIFEFKKTHHTIDASKLNRTEILSKLYGNYSVTGAGDAVDPSSVNNDQYPLGIDNYLSTKQGIDSHNNQYIATFHYCFIQGKSIKITLTSLGSGKLRFAFTGTGGTGSFDYNLKSVPSVADTSLYIRDYVIKSKGFFSMLSAIGKKLGLKKGKVAPNPENGNGPSFFAGFFEELVKAVGKASGKPLSNEEVTVILSSFKTIGDQVRSKDAQMLKGDLISLDNFLLDMVTASNICRSVGEIISGSEVVGIKIYESIDNDKQLAGLIETYNKPTLQPKPVVDITGADTVRQIAIYTKAINDMRTVEEQRRKDVIIAAENAAKAKTLSNINEYITPLAQPLGDLISSLLEKTVQPFVGVGRRPVQPQPDDMDIIINGMTTVKQKDFMIVYRRLHFQHFVNEFYAKVLPVGVDITNVPLQYLYAIEHIAKDYNDKFINDINAETAYTEVTPPPIDVFITVLKDTRKFKIDDNTILYINNVIKALDAVSIVKELWRNKLVTLFTNDPYKKNEYCVNYIPTFAGGGRILEVGKEFKEELVDLLNKYIKWATVKPPAPVDIAYINNFFNIVPLATPDTIDITDVNIETLLFQTTDEFFADMRMEIYKNGDCVDDIFAEIFTVLEDTTYATPGKLTDRFMAAISSKVKHVIITTRAVKMEEGKEEDGMEAGEEEEDVIVEWGEEEDGEEEDGEAGMEDGEAGEEEDRDAEMGAGEEGKEEDGIQNKKRQRDEDTVGEVENQGNKRVNANEPEEHEGNNELRELQIERFEEAFKLEESKRDFINATGPITFSIGKTTSVPKNSKLMSNGRFPNVRTLNDLPRSQPNMNGQNIFNFNQPPRTFGGKRTRKRQHKLKSKKHNKTNQKRKQQKHTRRISYVKNKQTRKKTQNR